MLSSLMPVAAFSVSDAPYNTKTAPAGWRFVARGETIVDGDKIPYGHEWNEVTEILVGQVVDKYPNIIRKIKV